MVQELRDTALLTSNGVGDGHPISLFSADLQNFLGTSSGQQAPGNQPAYSSFLDVVRDGGFPCPQPMVAACLTAKDHRPEDSGAQDG